MKNRFVFSALLIFMASLLFTACKTSDIGTGPEDAYPPSVEEVMSTEAPTPTVPAGQALYPEVGDKSDVFWGMAEGMILHGEVSSIVIMENLKIQLNLKDGRVLFSLQPTAESVSELLKTCGDVCKDLTVTNE